MYYTGCIYVFRNTHIHIHTRVHAYTKQKLINKTSHDLNESKEWGYIGGFGGRKRRKIL